MLTRIKGDNMIKALCIGQACYDITIVVDEFPKEDTRERFIHKIGCGGGSAANCAYLLAKWGLETTFAGVIGNDIFGNRIKKEFEEVKIDTRFIETSYENDTAISFVIVNKASSSRTLFNVADEYVKLKKYTFDFTPDIIVTDGHDTYASKTVLQNFPKSLSVLDANRVTPEILELGKYVKYIVCSENFATEVAGSTIDFNNTGTLANVYYKLKAKFPKAEIVITLGEKGALYCLENQIKVSPSLKVPIADPNGLKDIFTGAFSYIIANGGDIEKAVKYANIAAGLSLGTVGTRLSIPSLENVEKLYVQNYE